jgi:hypothetical protein
MRLNQAAVDRERYLGKSYVDEQGRTQWSSCVVWDEDIPGFGLRIHPPAAGGQSRKEFVFTYTVGIRSRVMNLGTYGQGCTFKQARRAAGEALACSRRGLDPIEARQAAQGVGTIEDLATRFLTQHVSNGPRKNVPGGD